jgi:hypothetical protein
VRRCTSDGRALCRDRAAPQRTLRGPFLRARIRVVEQQTPLVRAVLPQPWRPEPPSLRERLLASANHSGTVDARTTSSGRLCSDGCELTLGLELSSHDLERILLLPALSTQRALALIEPGPKL